MSDTHEPAIIGEEIVYDAWMQVRRLSVRMPDGEVVERHVEDHGAAVAVLLYDPARRTAILVSMPRPPVIRAGQAPVLEVVAGRMEADGADYTVRKEAMEEAGVLVTEVELVTILWTMPSVSTERVHLYLARYDCAARISAGGGAADENEGITVHELKLASLAAMACDGRLTDAKTLVLVQALLLREPELFTTG